MRSEPTPVGKLLAALVHEVAATPHRSSIVTTARLAMHDL